MLAHKLVTSHLSSASNRRDDMQPSCWAVDDTIPIMVGKIFVSILREACCFLTDFSIDRYPDVCRENTDSRWT